MPPGILFLRHSGVQGGVWNTFGVQYKMSESFSEIDLLNEVIYTLSLGRVHTLSLTDDEISCYLFEECDVGVFTFLHDTSLNRLLSSGHVSHDIARQCQDIRRIWIDLSVRNMTVSEVRNSGAWKCLLETIEKTFQQIVDFNSGSAAS